jgi:geranylgeranyl transferase type-2 subunit beta
MSQEPYLIRLAARLLGGLTRLDDNRRECHRAFILKQQRPNGGFCGRQGSPDLYYTSFAARALALLGRLSAEESGKLAEFLLAQSNGRLSVIDLVSWLNTAFVIRAFGGIDLEPELLDGWLVQQVQGLEDARTGDGGYAKVPGSASGSTYHSFLAALAHELVELPIPDRDALIDFAVSRQRDDGGFVDIAAMKRSGTNPTAAAVGVLTMTDRLDMAMRAKVGGFLATVKHKQGGFQANTRMPIADGLSTFTGAVTALDLGFDDMIDPNLEESFVADQLEVAAGGFRAAGWDDQPDVEYTYYGLGVLSLLWAATE